MEEQAELTLLGCLINPLGTPENENSDYQDLIVLLFDCLKNNPEFVSNLKIMNLEAFQTSEQRGEILLELIRLNFRIQGGPIALLPMHLPLPEITSRYQKFLNVMKENDPRRHVVLPILKALNNETVSLNEEKIRELESENQRLYKLVSELESNNEKLKELNEKSTQLINDIHKMTK